MCAKKNAIISATAVEIAEIGYTFIPMLTNIIYFSNFTNPSSPRA